MRCAECRPLVSKYADGEALPAERDQVEVHIGACRACSTLLVQYRITRSRVGNLPRYQPDPGLRARLLASMEATRRQPEEIVITRRVAAPAVRPVRYPARPFAGLLLGHLASAFALLVVVTAGLLVWQVTGGPPPQAAYATGTPLGLIIPVVPTHFVPLATGNGNLPAPLVTPVVGIPHPGSGDAHAASPTATFWNASEDAQTVHTVRDDTYGYQFQYPAGWWTATSLSMVGSTGLLARRLLRPWTRQDGSTADYAITLDVLANPDQVKPAGALSNLSLLASWKTDGATTREQPVTYNGLDGFALLNEDGSQQATYLFAGALVYRVSLVVKSPKHPSSNYTPLPASGGPGAQVVAQVLHSFRPDAQVTTRSAIGYTPVLCLHGGEVWEVDPAGGQPRPVTQTGGQVRSFALASDLSHLALILGQPGNQQIVVQVLGQTTTTELWRTNDIRAVAWDGDQALIALGGAPAGPTPVGLYRLSLQSRLQLPPLADFSDQPGLLSTASNLSVAPDRQWISFLATGDSGPALYTLRPDGRFMSSLLGPGAGHPVVTQYAWLPPAEVEIAPRMMLVADRQLQQLTLPGPGAILPQMKPITALPGTTFSDLVVAGGEVAALAWAGSMAKVYLQPDQAPAGAHMMDLAAPPITGSLSLAGSGRAVFYQQSQDTGATRVLMVDAANGAVHPLGEMPR